MPTARIDAATLAEWQRKGLIASDSAAREVSAPTLVEPTEEEFQAEVVAFAKRHGWDYYHTRNSRKSVAGFPDLVLIRATVLLVAELKVGDNKPTAPQLRWRELFMGVGVPAFIWRPSDWPLIHTILGGPQRETAL